MKASMISRDASTFVALAQAVALARAEGVLEEDVSVDLSAALVAGILTGCMEMETYGRVHEAMARLLEKAFEGARLEPPPAERSGEAETEGPLGVYLEVVGEAWDKVSWEEEACARLKTFAREAFDLNRARFGDEGWFEAPLRRDPVQLLRRARSAGLLIVSIEGALPAARTTGVLRDAGAPATAPRVLLGWGDRRIALDVAAASQS